MLATVPSESPRWKIGLMGQLEIYSIRTYDCIPVDVEHTHFCLGMVLFYCTLVALKRQDDVPVSSALDDFFQPGEKEEFGGYAVPTSRHHIIHS
jgi:hypothetical protein